MALTEIPIELSSTPSIVDGGNATAITIDSSENVTFAGNVGIGQAPSAFSNWKILEIKGGTAGAMLNFENSSSTRVSSLAYDDGSDSLRIQNFLANPITFETNNTERMRIDSLGSVGIGVVPEAWHSSYDVLQISSGASIAGSVTNRSRLFLNANTYINTSNVQSYIATDEASQYWQNGGTHIFNVAPSGSADSAISWTTAMTIDNSGYVTTPQNPMFRGSYTGSAISTSGGIIPQNAHIQNRNMAHSGGNRITVPVAGVYLLVHHQLADAVGTQTKIKINGVDLAGSRTQNTSSNNESLTTALPIVLAALDYVEFVLNSGTAHGNPNYNTMSVTLIG